jgi:hypothetical protein
MDDELSRIRQALAVRAETIPSLSADRLREACQEGEHLAQRLLLIRAVMRSELERLNVQDSLLRAIMAQTVEPAGPRFASSF